MVEVALCGVLGTTTRGIIEAIAYRDNGLHLWRSKKGYGRSQKCKKKGEKKWNQDAQFSWNAPLAAAVAAPAAAF